MANKGNRGFASLIAGEGAGPREARLPPRTGILQGRENRLAALAVGTTVSRVHELVDPVRCRIWAGHNRNYAALNEVACADLLESLRAQGRQEVPAIVRRVADDPAHDWEVICGARRHWSITWLRRHDHLGLRFLIEPRELTDEEAFRIADLENRSRKDLSDFERAVDYARAVDRYYGGSQQRMAERLQVSRSWLSRYLELARLPPEVIAAYGNPHTLGISHAARLAPSLRAPAQRDALLREAVVLAAEQAKRVEAGQGGLPASAVTRRLEAAKPPARRPPAKALPQAAEAKGADGRTIARAERVRGGTITITLPKPDGRGLDELLGGVETVLKGLSA